MKFNDKRHLVAAAVVLAALVGAGTAFATTKLTGNGHHHAPMRFTMPGGGGPMQSGGGGPRFGAPQGGNNDLATAAIYLGISQDTLRSDLQSGKTLAQVAKATSGKSVAGLIAALVAKEKTDSAAAVTAMVNGTFPGPHGLRNR
ncbi:MAG TPA: hypothetical protein VGL84_01720 [Gaiellaceae bacterium]|jgi:hypothetical protein